MDNKEEKVSQDDLWLGRRVKVKIPKEEIKGEIVAIDFIKSSVIIRKDNPSAGSRFMAWDWDDLYEEKKR